VKVKIKTMKKIAIKKRNSLEFILLMFIIVPVMGVRAQVDTIRFTGDK
jgi:hypothetical protein